MPPLSGSFLGRVAVAVIAGIVGFLLVSQLRGQERFTQRLEAESEGDLARILASLNAESDSLREEIASLKLQLLTLQNSSARDDAAVRAAREQLDALQVLAGTVPVHGPGVVVEIEDPRHSLNYDTMVDVVQELRDAGAEAIAVSDVRVGVASAFSPSPDGVSLDGVVLRPPYRVVAIGRPETLDAGLRIPGGIIDTLAASKGVRVSVKRLADVQVPALAEPLRSGERSR